MNRRWIETATDNPWRSFILAIAKHRIELFRLHSIDRFRNSLIDLSVIRIEAAAALLAPYSLREELNVSRLPTLVVAFRWSLCHAVFPSAPATVASIRNDRFRPMADFCRPHYIREWR